MTQKDKESCTKKPWEKPLLVDLSVEADTKTGGLGFLADFTNTTSATNTLPS